MDVKYSICCLVLVWIASSSAQDDVRITSLTPTTIATKAGGEVTMTCVFNQNLQIILAQNLQWAHRSSVPGSEPVLLTDQATLQAGATPPEKYNIVFDTQEDTTIALTVKNLDASDDGEFICQASPKAAGADQNDNLISSIKTTIFSDVENVELTFEEEASVSDESGTVVQRQMGGPFKVMCTASGFNPASGVSVVVTLDGQQVATTMGEATLHEDMTAAAGAARYTVTVEGEIELGPEHHQKRVQCEARATFEGAAESFKASIPFDVVVY